MENISVEYIKAPAETIIWNNYLNIVVEWLCGRNNSKRNNMAEIDREDVLRWDIYNSTEYADYNSQQGVTQFNE